MIRHRICRLAAWIERVRHAWDLYSRLGFPWASAWRIGGTWQ